MSEESTTPDLVELTRVAWEVVDRHDRDRVTSFYAPDAVLDLADVGLGTFAGVPAIGSFLEEWWRTWADHLVDVQEIVDLGHGVVFASVREDGRLAGSDGHVEQRLGWVVVWVQGRIERATPYFDIDGARAAAERLAEERGSAMSQENVEVVRRILEHIRAGEFELDAEGLLAKWADEAVLDPDVEWDASEVPMLDMSGVYHGVEGVRQYWRQWYAAWEVVAHFDYRLVDAGDRVVALFEGQRMRGRSTGMEVPVVPYATVTRFRDGRIVHWKLYMSQSEVLKALGLAE